MLNITVICVGKLKEREYSALCDEYIKRLARYCHIRVVQIEEQKLPENPSAAQITGALLREAELIRSVVPRGAFKIALCIEGDEIKSEELAERIQSISRTNDKLCFIVGGSNGLDKIIKDESQFRLSFSKMTFPHHLFRIMLLEQIYRAFTITAGTKYHK